MTRTLTKPMVKAGARVRCIALDGPCPGKTGRVERMERAYGGGVTHAVVVTDDQPKPRGPYPRPRNGYVFWISLEALEVIG